MTTAAVVIFIAFDIQIFKYSLLILQYRNQKEKGKSMMKKKSPRSVI